MFSVFNMWVFKGSLLALCQNQLIKQRNVLKSAYSIAHLTPFVVDFIT